MLQGILYLVDELSVDSEYTSSDNSTSMTPLHVACSKGHLELVKFLMKRDVTTLK